MDIKKEDPKTIITAIVLISVFVFIFICDAYNKGLI